MKILVLIDQFSFGGGARVVSRLLDGFVMSGHCIVLATKIEEKDKMYPINNSVELVSFDYTGGTNTKYSSISSLNHLVGIKECRRLAKEHRPDIIIAEMAQTYMWAYLGTRGLNIPLIAHDHTSFGRKLKPLYNFIRFHLYGYAESLVILTKRDENILGNKFPNKQVIYNPLPFNPMICEETRERRNSILCVGRFDVWDVKGFDIIIDIFSRLSSKYPDWKLEFAGTGTESAMGHVKDLVANARLSEKVIYHGQVANIKELYREVKIFALPSRVEGLPMGLMEAMSQGCACVAFEVGGATNEMVENGVSGFCIQDGKIEDFEKQLTTLMENENVRRAIASRAIQESYKFSLDQIAVKWDEIFNKLNTCKRG